MANRAELRGILEGLPELETLSEVELEVFNRCLDEMVEGGGSPLASALILTDYKWEPVSMAHFLSDPYYAGDLTKDLFPMVRALLIETFDTGRRPTELVLAGATGWGKTTALGLCCVYMAYRLSCLRDPHEYYGLMRGAPIVLGLYSVSEDQAFDTVYGKVLTWVDAIPYFVEKAPRVRRINSKIKFAQSPVEIVTGSKELHTIGKDLFFAGIDEANFMQAANGNVDDGVAATIYTSVSRRLKSRFMTSSGEPAGMAVISSSKRTKASFVENHLKDNQGDVASGIIKVASYTQWEVRPASKYTKPRFRVQLGDRIHPARILLPGEDPRPGASVIFVPGEYRRDFEQDVDKALRDIAGVASESMAPLLHDKTCLARCEALAKHAHPFTRSVVTISTEDDIGIEAYFRPELMFKVVRSKYVLRLNPHCSRYIHVDVGLTNDCMGLAMCHIAGYKMVKRLRKDGTGYEDKAPVVVVDFMLRCKPPGAGEIDLGKVRAFIASLRDYGISIARLSYDGYQCFTGDTRVRLRDGTSPTMAELAAEYGRSREFWVYSYDPVNRRFTQGRARNARKTGAKRIMVVEVDGKPVRCTEDHMWMLRDGRWCAARNLRPGFSLMALQTRISNRGAVGASAGHEMPRQPCGCVNRGWRQMPQRTVADAVRGRGRRKACRYRGFVKSNDALDAVQWTAAPERRRLQQKAGVGEGRGWCARLAPDHEVTAVRFTGQVEDVYDIEVEDHHNFVLDVGVVVHNSRDSCQIMRKLGYDSVVYSVDKTDEAYLSLKQALVEDRLYIYHYEPFVQEISELERDLDRAKVDHPRISPSTGKPGSKDVSDAVAGCVFNALIDKRVAIPGIIRSTDPVRDDVAAKVSIPGGSVLWSDLEKEVRS